jgi:hypothetical protein
VKDGALPNPETGDPNLNLQFTGDKVRNVFCLIEILVLGFDDIGALEDTLVFS